MKIVNKISVLPSRNDSLRYGVHYAKNSLSAVRLNSEINWNFSFKIQTQTARVWYFNKFIEELKLIMLIQKRKTSSVKCGVGC